MTAYKAYAYVLSVLSAIILGCALLSALHMQAHTAPYPPEPFQCHAEDEVPVYVARQSYDLPAGLPQCVHIDNIKDPQ